jgi:hypothetical protein
MVPAIFGGLEGSGTRDAVVACRRSRVLWSFLSTSSRSPRYSLGSLTLGTFALRVR